MPTCTKPISQAEPGITTGAGTAVGVTTTGVKVLEQPPELVVCK